MNSMKCAVAALTLVGCTALAVGCIQSQKCHTGHCPTGVATQNAWLVRGLDPVEKGHRCAQYIRTFRKEMVKVSEAVGVAQPTLSAAIRQLEESLGVMLVRRGSRYGGLTPEGERVLDWARRIVSDARAMREELRVGAQGLSGSLRLAVIPTALAAAPHRIEGRFAIGGQDHFYLEGQIALAIPGEDDDVALHVSTQHPSEVQHMVAHVLSVPSHSVVVNVRRMGGGFGGKETQMNLFACVAAAFGRRRLWLTVPVGILLALAIYGAFALLLNLDLPAGPIERLAFGVS